MKVAFLVGVFPVVSETFVIDQIADLRARGVEIEIFAFGRGDGTNVSRRYFEHEMGSSTTYITVPARLVSRLIHALPIAFKLALRDPRTLVRSLNVARYGRDASSLRLLYWSGAFSRKSFDLVHCHFGVVGRHFAVIREAVRLDADFVTSLYGFDVSQVFRHEPADYYDRLKEACSLYFVMSDDMRRRVVDHGFPADRVVVHPVSVDVDSYTYRVRTLNGPEPLRLLAVGRLVEKKGFDDLLRAVAIARERASRPVACEIIGGGEREDELRQLSASLGLDDVVTFRGYAPVEQVVEAFDDAHVLLQPSKTAANGDME